MFISTVGQRADSVTLTHMNKIAGTDIWYYDFDTPLSPGANCFLFKDTESTWKTQTSDLTVADGKNCFRANPGSKSGGVSGKLFRITELQNNLFLIFC